jgi:AcrR family transcriptional regulator
MVANMKKRNLSKEATREHILKVASELFYTQGIRAVGIDTIVAKSGVAKTTLYDHFPSKDMLVHSYLMSQDQMFWKMWELTLDLHPNSPKKQITDLFEMFEAGIQTPEVLGCAFLSAVSEYPEYDQPIHQLAILHKQKVKQSFQELAKEAGVSQPELLAEQLLLLLNGAFATKRVFGVNENSLRQVANIAKTLLNAHLAGDR